MIRKLVVLSVFFLAATVYADRAMRPELVPLRQPLAQLPMQLGEWSGRDAPRLTDQVLAVLGADDYVNRFYTSERDLVSVYIGYYQSQREGDTIHSPLNCIPGSGWQPVESTNAEVTVPGRAHPILVNRVIIEKGLDRQVVLYWYQSQGRVVASEYWSKIFMVLDAIRSNRSDAALVRIVSPVLGSESGTAAAERRATMFVQSLFDPLERHLPS